MTEAIVSFRKVTKIFRGVPALREVDLDIPAGRFVGLAGENGAGKTTLLKCMLDFCSMDSGEIFIHGIPSSRPAARARLVFLPERFMPPWFLTGREFVHFMLQLRGASCTSATLESMFADLGLDLQSLDKPVRSYSKGMTQKLGLAAAFLSPCDLYVLDEPMSGLDPVARARVKDILKGLAAAGRTLLFTSHSLADVDEICDHMAVLHRGALAFHGSPQDLRERYREASLEQAFLKCVEAGTDA
jgi:ABC-2 type transport system ATP-binding protein